MTATEFAYLNFFNHSETLPVSCSHRCNRSPAPPPPAPASAPRSPELSVHRSSDPASPRGAWACGCGCETAAAKAERTPRPPLFVHRHRGQVWGAAPGGRGGEPGEGSCKRKTFQMQQIAEEKAREVRTRGVLGGCACMCVRVLDSTRRASL